MANVTTIIGTRSATLDSSGASQTLAIDPDKRYLVRHLFVDASGTEDTNEVKLELSKVNGADADAAVADRVEDSDQLLLNANSIEWIIPRGTHQVKFINFGGAPMLNVVEVDRHPGFG